METLMLPTGSRVVSRRGLNKTRPMAKKSKEHLWYALFERFEEYPTGFDFPATRKRKLTAWAFAHTKQWIRDQARAAQREGWTVVDICKGTRRNMRHKFTGLDAREVSGEQNSNRPKRPQNCDG